VSRQKFRANEESKVLKYNLIFIIIVVMIRTFCIILFFSVCSFTCLGAVAVDVAGGDSDGFTLILLLLLLLLELLLLLLLLLLLEFTAALFGLCALTTAPSPVEPCCCCWFWGASEGSRTIIAILTILYKAPFVNITKGTLIR